MLLSHLEALGLHGANGLMREERAMGLLDIFRRPTLVDSRLGELRYRRGWWTTRYASCFGSTQVEVRIPGSREGFSGDSRALFDAVELAYVSLRPQILKRFWAHYEPYAEEIAKMPPDEAKLVRSINRPEDLWAHARLVAVTVNAYQSVGDTELRYRTDWDIEHTLGITIADGHVTAFCGSVGPWT
jgi:uncharacterized protein DUF6985